jgi:hypothetical protein
MALLLAVLAGHAVVTAHAAEGPVVVDAGNYTTTDGDDRDLLITLTRPLLVDATVVTVDEFRSFVAATGHTTATDSVFGQWWADPGHAQRSDWPVVQVSFEDAIRLANWRSRRDGLEPAYDLTDDQPRWRRDADGWRLPTEAEWEYLARCGGACLLPVDVAPLGPVRAARANDIGLRGMLDDVLEWCWDGYQAARRDTLVDPVGFDPAGRRVIRGVDLTSRDWGAPDFRASWLGFRLVRWADALTDLEVRRTRQHVATAQRRREYRLEAMADSLVWADRDRREPVRQVGGAIATIGAVVGLVGWSLVTGEDTDDDVEDTGVDLLLIGVGSFALGGVIYLAAGRDLDRDAAMREAAELLPRPRAPAMETRVGLAIRF